MATSVVSEELVEQAWREVGSSSHDDVNRIMERASKLQPALLAYVMGETSQSRSDVAELAVYIYIVVFRMFDKLPGHKLKRVPIEKLERLIDENEQWLESLGSTHDRFFDRIAEVEAGKQPHVLRYIVEAIFEGEDPSPKLTDDEQGLVFLILKTALDVLDGACKKRPRF